MLRTRIFHFGAIAALALNSNIASAHLNIAVEDAVAVGDGSREYKEGSSAFLDVNIAHDCTSETGQHYATTGITVLLPNTASAPATYTSDTDGNLYGANAVMGVKQRMNPTFKKNIVIKGPVEPFYSHGINTEDARALKWLIGRVDNDHYENLEFKASFPTIDPTSCVTKINVYFPSMQYCQNGYKAAWINTAESKYGLGDAKTHVYDDYAAYVTVVRTSDLPSSCGGEGETIEVMPSVEDINTYLDMHSSGMIQRHTDDD